MTTSWNGRRTGPGASSSTACPYHPGSISNEGVAVAFQLGRGEGLVDVFNGVGADHSSAPENEGPKVILSERITVLPLVKSD